LDGGSLIDARRVSEFENALSENEQWGANRRTNTQA
jgi:hypothetical protein